MDVVYNVGGLRVIDLTKTLDPKTETRRCHLYRFNTGGPIPDFHTIMDLQAISVRTANARIIMMISGQVSRICRSRLSLEGPYM